MSHLCKNTEWLHLSPEHSIVSQLQIDVVGLGGRVGDMSTGGAAVDASNEAGRVAGIPNSRHHCHSRTMFNRLVDRICLTRCIQERRTDRPGVCVCACVFVCTVCLLRTRASAGGIAVT